MKSDAKSTIEAGKAILGIEFGSTRIKAVLIDQENKPIAQGSHSWENQLVDGLWTYSIEAIWHGLQDCYADLRSNVKELYDTEIESLAAIGISAMMHGYMAFNKKEEILVPFRTWRNTNTGPAAAALSELFVYNIPLRWSISHLYQAILDNEKHVSDIDYLTTLAGFIHWQITGQKVLGIGDASGMLPIDPATKDYSAEMIAKFDWITFRYEYSHKLLAYCIEVLPANSIERSEEYANEEYNFSCDFEQKFNESVIFSNGTEFYRCSENAVVIGQVRQKNIEWIKDDSFILDLEDYILDFKDDNFKKIESGIFATCKKWDNYNFDLAA